MKYSVSITSFIRNYFAFPVDFHVSRDEVANILRINADEVGLLVVTGNLPYPDGETWGLSEIKGFAKKIGGPENLRGLIQKLKKQ